MSRATALVVDDNRQNLDVLVRLLAREDVQADEIQNARQVRTALEQGAHYDIVFLDLELPFSNGYEVLAALRATPALADVPVIAYTVHLSEMVTAQEYGFDGFLGKPLDSDRFPAQLERILNGEPVWDSA